MFLSFSVAVKIPEDSKGCSPILRVCVAVCQSMQSTQSYPKGVCGWVSVHAQSMLCWLHLFRPEVRQNIMVVALSGIGGLLTERQPGSTETGGVWDKAYHS